MVRGRLTGVLGRKAEAGPRQRLLAFLGFSLACALVLGAVVAFTSPFLSVGLVGVVLVGVAMLGSLERGLIAFLAVVMLLPFAAVPVGVGFNPTFLDGVLVAIFAVWLVRASSRPGERALATPLTFPLALFILLAFVSFVVGLGHGGMNKNVLRHFAEVVVSILLFFVVEGSVRERKALERLARAIIFIGFSAAAVGLVLYFLPQALTVRILSTLRVFNYPEGWGVLRFIEDDPSLPMRATSTSIDPNVLGGLLILVAALAIPQLFTRFPLLPRAWMALLVLVLLTCMVLTFSRGSMLGLSLALIFIALVRYRRLLAVLALAAAVMAFLPQTQQILAHFWRGFLLEDRATLMRLGEYRDAVALISRYPWFGVGFTGTPSIELYVGVSNVYLLMAEEMGLVGLGAFLVVMLAFFARALPALRSPERDTSYAILLGVMGALVGALVGGLFDHYFFNIDFPHSVALFWFYVGLAVAAAKVAARAEVERGAPALKEGPTLAPAGGPG